MCFNYAGKHEPFKKNYANLKIFFPCLFNDLFLISFCA